MGINLDTGLTDKITVYMVETGEYESSFVQGIFSSLETAINAVKRSYPSPPYAVKWSGPTEDKNGKYYTLTGYFLEVPGYCSCHTDVWTITPVVIDDES